MKQFTLKYGKESRIISFPDDTDVTPVEPQETPPLPDPAAVLRDAMRDPIGLPALQSIVSPEMKIGIIFNDITNNKIVI